MGFLFLTRPVRDEVVEYLPVVRWNEIHRGWIVGMMDLDSTGVTGLMAGFGGVERAGSPLEEDDCMRGHVLESGTVLLSFGNTGIQVEVSICS